MTMLKFTNLNTVITTALFLLPIRLVFSQLPAEGQVCYIQRQDGLIQDLTNLCKPESKPPVLTDLERETQQLVSLDKELKEICTRLPEVCRSQTRFMNELNRICSSPGHCPDSIIQSLQEYALRRSLKNP